MRHKKYLFCTRQLDKLYDATVDKVITEWLLLGDPMKTMRFDGYRDSNSNSVLNITVYALRATACEDSIDPRNHTKDHL